MKFKWFYLVLALFVLIVLIKYKPNDLQSLVELPSDVVTDVKEVIKEEGPWKVLNKCGYENFGGKCDVTSDCLRETPTGYDGVVDLSEQTSIPKLFCCVDDHSCSWR